MPLFGENSSPYDEVVEKATAETVTSENWALILDICDRVTGEGSKGAKHCLLSIKKRLNHRDPHVVMLALSVLDSLWNNCGSVFQREVSSREFTSELLSKATHSNPPIAEKTRLLIKKWVDNECKKDPSLNLVDTLYLQLERDGYSFESSEPKKTSMKLPTDLNVVMTNEEEEAIAKAIALSLKENDAKAAEPKAFKTNIYPTAAPPAATVRTVKALYDFEAVEDNELTFFTGDIISVLDDSDVNWWKGRSHRGEGLFPASFVTLDMSPSTNGDLASSSGKRKSVQFDDNVDIKEVEPAPLPKPEPKIDEEVLVRCLDMLRDADPTGEHPDPPEMDSLEEQSLAQIPLIDRELAEVDRRHNLLAEVDVKIRDVLALYDAAMQEASMQFQQHQQLQYAQQPTLPSYGQMPPQPPTYAQPQYAGYPTQPTSQSYVDPNAQVSSVAPGAYPSQSYQHPHSYAQ